MPKSPLDPLAGIQAKLDRAKEQLKMIGTEAEALINEGNAYSIVGQFEPERHAWVERVKVNRPPPLRLGVLLGEYIHSLRSALDHLMWQVTLRDGGTPNDSTQFPIASKSEAQFNNMANRRIPDLSKEHRALVQKAQPYHAGDQAFTHPLAVLADFSNIDKHQIVHPTFAQVGDREVAPLKRINGEGGPSPVKRVSVAPVGQPVIDGAPLVTIEFWPTEEPPIEVKVGGHFVLDVAFGERALHWKSLPGIGEYVVRVLSAFAVEFPTLE
jgi:hypothetical protein